jgi:hypothetical protein
MLSTCAHTCRVGWWWRYSGWVILRPRRFSLHRSSSPATVDTFFFLVACCSLTEIVVNVSYPARHARIRSSARKRRIGRMERTRKRTQI